MQQASSENMRSEKIETSLNATTPDFNKNIDDEDDRDDETELVNRQQTVRELEQNNVPIELENLSDDEQYKLDSESEQQLSRQDEVKQAEVIVKRLRKKASEESVSIKADPVQRRSVKRESSVASSQDSDDYKIGPKHHMTEYGQNVSFMK